MRLMKDLVALLIFALLAISQQSAQGTDSGAADPVLDVSSISGRLQLDLPSTLTIELRNNASSLPKAEGFDSQKRDAMGITAQLLSSDERVKVLSAPQPAGALGPGENRTLEFTALATDSEAGVYPLQLLLSYFWLSDVAASGDESIPDLLFSYQNNTLEIPLQASVALGPQIQVEETRGEAHPGKETELQLRMVNRGDEPAVDLQVEASSQPPFRAMNAAGEGSRLEPGGSMIEKLRIFTDNSTAQGYYALPYKIFYGDGDRRSRESAALVYVESDSLFTWILPLLGILLLVGAALGAREYLKRKSGWRMKRRLRG